MTHHFELKAYHCMQTREVEIFKATVSLSGKAVLPRSKAIFKDANLDCYNLRHERILVTNYWNTKK